MGVIKRQGLKTILVNYVGVAIGALSVLFIYPLNDELYGFAQWVYSTIILLAPLASFGISSVVLKFYPVFKSKVDKANHGFLNLILLIFSASYLVFLICWFAFKPFLLQGFEYLNMDGSAIVKHEWYLLALVYLLVAVMTATNHSANHLRIVVPNIVHQLGFKLLIPLIVLMSTLINITEQHMAFYILLFYGLVLLILTIYLKSIGALHFGKIKRPSNEFSFKSIFYFGGFSSLNSLGSSLAFRLDTIMIPFLENMLSNGYYNKIAFMSNTLEMPYRAINQIAAPIISKAWNDNDISELKTVYRKSSTNLFLVGAALFTLIWYVLDDLIAISIDPNSFPFARDIFLFLALGKLFDMLTSVNSQIIIYSKSYKYNLAFLLILGVSNIFLNYYLIRTLEYGIVGAAMATALSLFIFNFAKLVFIYFKFGLHPFSVSTLKTLLLLGLLILVYFYFPEIEVAIFALILKGIFVTLVFSLVTYYWNISKDINDTILNLISRLKSKWS
ncbi:MAG: oligosaccharide flippase family protein [Saprospiraceae bacterium]|nr:oligosaccharide flippase family protein [Saprospiraceae bacterium]